MSGRRWNIPTGSLSQTLEEVEVNKEQVQGLHAHLIEHGVDVIAEDGLTAYDARIFERVHLAS
jgi:hypothetical protein